MKLSHRVTALAASATAAVSGRAAELKRSGVDVIGFGVGEPDFDTPEPIKAAAIDALRAGQTKYSKPFSGLPDVRAAICEKLARDSKVTYGPNEVMVTVGCKEAIYLALMSLVDPGDEVLLPVPYWVSYPSQIELAGGTPIAIRGEESRAFKVTAKQIADAITPRTRVLLLNYPNNPAGYNYSADELKPIVEVARSHDLWVISDELYDGLVYGNEGFTSFAAVKDANRERIIIVHSTSKTHSMTGWRIGFAAGPEPVIKAMSKLQTHTTSGACTFNQFGMAAALRADSSMVHAVRDEYRRRRKMLCDGLNALPGVSCIEPAGAFYCFPNVSKTYEKLGVRSSTEFAAKLLEEAHVAVVPGAAFGSDEHVRLAFATAPEVIEAGLARMRKFLAE